eukprot:s7109_g4.t1
MEAAAAAIPEAGPEEDDQLDAMTVAEPEMEVDVQGSDPEPEHTDDIPDIDEYPEEVNDNSNETRQAVLLTGVTPMLEPKLQIARTAMQPIVYLDIRGELEDPDKCWLIRKFRTNQVLSSIIRGAEQLGYGRQAFNPTTYLNRGQDAKEMHFCCLGLLNEVIPKVTGYTMYSLIRPAPNRPTAYLYIDPVGCVLVQSVKETPALQLGFLIDHDMQVPVKFVEKISKRKIDAEVNPQHHNKRIALITSTQENFWMKDNSQS